MNTINRTGWLNGKNLFVFILGMVAIYFMVTSLVNNRFSEIELNTRIQIADQQAVLSTIAETTARNGADAVTESIVQDCVLSERSRFDELLSQLDKGLNKTELVELERLFGRCASFSSDRKAVMVARFSREIDIYEDYVNQLSAILDEDVTAAFSVASWQALAAEERKQSQLFSKLVGLQDQIISNLLEGKTTASPEIKEILRNVQDVKETLLVANKQAASLREELISL